MQTAEYSVTAGICKELDFNWWVPTLLRKKHRMIGKMNKGITQEEYEVWC